MNLSQTASLAGYNALAEEPTTGSAVSASVSLTSLEKNKLAAQFISDELGFSVVPSGVQRFTLEFLKENESDILTTYVIVRFTDSAGTPVGSPVVSSGANIGWVDASTPASVVVDAVFPTTSIDPTWRAWVRVFINNQDNQTRNVDFVTEGSDYSYVITSVGFESGTSGTSGTDGIGSNGTSGTSGTSATSGTAATAGTFTSYQEASVTPPMGQISGSAETGSACTAAANQTNSFTTYLVKSGSNINSGPQIGDTVYSDSGLTTWIPSFGTDAKSFYGFREATITYTYGVTGSLGEVFTASACPVVTPPTTLTIYQNSVSPPVSGGLDTGSVCNATNQVTAYFVKSGSNVSPSIEVGDYVYTDFGATTNLPTSSLDYVWFGGRDMMNNKITYLFQSASDGTNKTSYVSQSNCPATPTTSLTVYTSGGSPAVVSGSATSGGACSEITSGINTRTVYFVKSGSNVDTNPEVGDFFYTDSGATTVVGYANTGSWYGYTVLPGSTEKTFLIDNLEGRAAQINNC